MTGSAPQAGFYYQNNIAALKIIESLFFNSDIQYIQLENYDRGNHIDDVISNAARPSKNITIGLNDFIKKVVLPIQTSGKQYDAIKTVKEFLPVVEVVRKETGLRKKEFTDFLSRLDFQLKQDSIHIIKDAIGLASWELKKT